VAAPPLKGIGPAPSPSDLRVHGPSFHAAKPNLQKDVAIFVAAVRAVRVPEFFDGAANPPIARSRLPIPQGDKQLRRLYGARRECGIDSLPPLPAAAPWRALQACYEKVHGCIAPLEGRQSSPIRAGAGIAIGLEGAVRSGVANAGSVVVTRAADGVGVTVFRKLRCGQPLGGCEVHGYT